MTTTGTEGAGGRVAGPLSTAQASAAQQEPEEEEEEEEEVEEEEEEEEEEEGEEEMEAVPSPFLAALDQDSLEVPMAYRSRAAASASEEKPTHRHSHAVVAVGECLYLYGGVGCEGSECLQKLWKYSPRQEQWLQVDDGRVEDAVARDCCDDEGPPPLFGHTLSWLEEFNTLILIGGCTMSDRFESGQNTTRNGTNSSRKRSDSSSVEKPPVVWHFDLENCHDENNRGKWVAGPVRFCMPNRWYHSATPTPVDDHRSKKAIYVFGGICHTSTPFLSKTSVSISSMSTTSRDSNPSRRNRRKGTALPAGLKTGNKSRLSSNGNATALTKGSASGDTGPDSVNPSVPPSPQFMSPADCWTSVGEVVGELWRLEVPNLSWELVSPTGRQLWQGQEGLTRPLSRCGASLACHNDSLFVFGGFEEHFCQGHGTRRGSTRHNMSERKAAASFLNDLWEFRLLETQWRPVNITGCIPRGRAWCSSGVLNQRLLIFGGEVSSLTVPREKEERRGRQCSEVFEFSFANKRWRQIFTEGQPLPAVSRAAAATIMRSQEIENGEEEEDEEGEGHEEAGENWIMVVCGGTRSVGKTELVYRRTVHLWGRSSVTDGARSLSVVEVLERLAESEAKMRIEVAAVSRQLDDRRAESSEYRELRGDPVVGEAVRSLVTQLQAAKDRRCCVICRDEEIQTVFDCGHMCCCEQCAAFHVDTLEDNHSQCPLCRADVTSYYKCHLHK